MFDASQDLSSSVAPVSAIMRVMQTLRRAHFLARLVLAWFALAPGVAAASPLVNPKAMELVCSAAGTVKLVQLDDGSNGSGSGLSTHLLDCPLCLVGHQAAPPAATHLSAQPAAALAYALHAPASAPLASRSAAALPARGPPALS